MHFNICVTDTIDMTNLTVININTNMIAFLISIVINIAFIVITKLIFLMIITNFIAVVIVIISYDLHLSGMRPNMPQSLTLKSNIIECLRGQTTIGY